MPNSKTVEHGPSMGEMTTTSSNSLPANRAETGRFVPGQSGNPSGRPKRDEDLAAFAVVSNTLAPLAGVFVLERHIRRVRVRACHIMATMATANANTDNTASNRRTIVAAR